VPVDCFRYARDICPRPLKLGARHANFSSIPLRAQALQAHSIHPASFMTPAPSSYRSFSGAGAAVFIIRKSAGCSGAQLLPRRAQHHRPPSPSLLPATAAQPCGESPDRRNSENRSPTAWPAASTWPHKPFIPYGQSHLPEISRLLHAATAGSYFLSGACLPLHHRLDKPGAGLGTMK